jgi:hypothetical protein
MTPIPAPSAEENTTTWTSGRWLRIRAVACTPSSRGMRTVHQHHIGTDRLGLGDPVQAVASLPNHLHAGVLEHSPQHPPHRRVVIDQQHPRHSGSLTRRRLGRPCRAHTRRERAYTSHRRVGGWLESATAGLGWRAILQDRAHRLIEPFTRPGGDDRCPPIASLLRSLQLVGLAGSPTRSNRRRAACDERGRGSSWLACSNLPSRRQPPARSARVVQQR